MKQNKQGSKRKKLHDSFMKKIVVTDSFQRRYTYVCTEPIGKNFDKEVFKDDIRLSNERIRTIVVFPAPLHPAMI